MMSQFRGKGGGLIRVQFNSKVAHVCSNYIKNWNPTFGLWKIRIMNDWMVSFEWKQSNITKISQKTGNLSQLCELITRVSVDNFF